MAIDVTSPSLLFLPSRHKREGKGGKGDSLSLEGEGENNFTKEEFLTLSFFLPHIEEGRGGVLSLDGRGFKERVKIMFEKTQFMTPFL
jgi:hypothetical protein